MAAKRASGPFAIRGLMVDPARLTERHEFYFDLLPQMAKWGFNTLWWHFVDDEGFRLKLSGHPELASPLAFSKAKTRRLIRAARDVGIDVVPEVESFGHARYITGLPRYAHLADGSGGHFNAICASRPESLRLLDEIITEVADVFESPYFHAGLDEVDFRGCPRCRRRGRGKPHWWIYAQHTKAVHKIVTGCGKRMIMWADHVEGTPALRKVLPKDIVLCHWQYSAVRPEEFRRSLDAGFQVIGAPAMLHYGNVIQPNAQNFQNLDAMVAAAGRLARRGLLGVVNTWWTARRMFRDAAMPVIAYTGRTLAAGKAADKAPFMRRFHREYFGLRDAPVARAAWRMHELALHVKELGACLFDSPADMHAAVNLARADGFDDRAERIHRCAAVLARAARKVARHKAEFTAGVLAAEAAAMCMDQARALAEAHERYTRAEWARDAGRLPTHVAKELAAVAEILAGMHERLDAMCKRADAEWDRTRYPSDPYKAARDPATIACPLDSLLGRMVRSRHYLRGIARQLRRGIAAYRRGGPFPTGVPQ